MFRCLRQVCMAYIHAPCRFVKRRLSPHFQACVSSHPSPATRIDSLPSSEWVRPLLQLIVVCTTWKQPLVIKLNKPDEGWQPFADVARNAELRFVRAGVSIEEARFNWFRHALSDKLMLASDAVQTHSPCTHMKHALHLECFWRIKRTNWWAPLLRLGNLKTLGCLVGKLTHAPVITRLTPQRVGSSVES